MPDDERTCAECGHYSRVGAVAKCEVTAAGNSPITLPSWPICVLFVERRGDKPLPDGGAG